MPYDPLKDFAPLIQTTAIPLVVVGSNKFAPTHFAEVVAMARQKPETLTMGNSGIGDGSPYRDGTAQQRRRGQVRPRPLQGDPAGMTT